MDRDATHRLSSGTMMKGRGPDGAEHTIPHVFTFQRGLRLDHAAALDARPDLCARLGREGIDPDNHHFASTAEELDAAIDAMLAETSNG